MNWQARRAQEALLGERPEEQVKKRPPAMNAMLVVQHLRDERNERTKKTDKGPIPQRNTDFQTIAQVKERTHIDIAASDAVRLKLEEHPKIEWAGRDRLRYKVRGRATWLSCMQRLGGRGGGGGGGGVCVCARARARACVCVCGGGGVCVGGVL